MATNADVIAHFRLITGVTSTYISDTALAAYITACLAEHDPQKTISDVSSSTAEITVLSYRLAEKYHLMRAGLAAEGYPISVQGEGYTDKSISVKRHLEMAAEFRDKYEKLSTSLGLPFQTINVSSLIRRKTEDESRVPSNLVLPLAKPILTATAGTGIVLLQWTRCYAQDFATYKVYYSTTATLSDPASVTRPGAKYKGIVDTATLDQTISVGSKNIWEVQDLTAGTLYYFVVVVENLNGLVSLSNEASATPA